MNRFTICWLACLGILIGGVCTWGDAGGKSKWVYPGPDGKLVYGTTPAGDRIMDFSYAGYMGGGVALPDVPVKLTVSPSGGPDDAAAIQAAIDKVSAMPLVGGFRGAVLLGPGTFNCSASINIGASGVVLRGSGAGPGGEISTINLTGKQHLGISVRRGGTGRGRGRGQGGGDATTEPGIGETGVSTAISDAYVPSGAISFHVADASRFAVGDDVSIHHPVTRAWVHFMEMDDLVRNGKPQTWLRPPAVLMTQRKIAGIVGNTITLDVPLSDSLDSRYLNPPGASMVKTQPPGEVSQVGIESLHIQCPTQQFNHTEPHFVAIRMNGQDCWMRDVISEETMDSIGVGGRRITLLRVVVNRTVPHLGASRPAEFAPNAGQVLLDRCAVKGDNVWFTATGMGQAGPIVLLNCTFIGNSDAESHQRWSTGILYDNCRVSGGGITLRDRGSMGSGHGWTMGWGVIWNCQASDYIVQNPPGALNWLIGSIGRTDQAPQPFNKGPDLPEGTIDSMGTPVAPQSLYLAQLAERLGPGALRNIGY